MATSGLGRVVIGANDSEQSFGVANVGIDERLFVGEASDTHTASATTLAIELRRWGELGGALVGDGQDRFIGKDDACADNLGRTLQLHSGDAAGVASLNADVVDRSSKHLAIARDDHDVGTCRSGECGGNRVLGFEIDELLTRPGSGDLVCGELLGDAVGGDDH